MLAKKLTNLFNKWCKETKRSGGVLIGRSFREFFNYVQDKTTTGDTKPAEYYNQLMKYNRWSKKTNW